MSLYNLMMETNSDNLALWQNIVTALNRFSGLYQKPVYGCFSFISQEFILIIFEKYKCSRNSSVRINNFIHDRRNGMASFKARELSYTGGCKKRFSSTGENGRKPVWYAQKIKICKNIIIMFFRQGNQIM